MPKNFSAKRLMGIDFSGQDLSKADFSGATLNGCQFVGSTLRSASFVSVRGMGCNFDDADLTDAQFEGARFMASTFRDSIIAGSDLDEATLMGCDLSGAINAAADDDVEEDDVEEDDVEEDDVEEDDESSASDYVHELNLGWVKLEASDHLSGVTGLMNAHLVDGSWVQTRTMNIAFTDCLIHLVESVDRELLLTVLRPGVSDPYRETLTAGESTFLIDKSDESWHARITNQL